MISTRTATSSAQGLAPGFKAAWIAADQHLGTAITALTDRSLNQRVPGRAAVEQARAAGQQARDGFAQLATAAGAPPQLVAISEQAGTAAGKGIDALDLALPNYDGGAREVAALSMGLFENTARSATYQFQQARDARFG